MRIATGSCTAGLKPTSIVFSSAGFPYVTDFAIATRSSGSESSQPLFGDPDYLSPEQWEGIPVPESDQYSLAALCYRILTGAVPLQDQIDPHTRGLNLRAGPVPADAQAKEARASGTPIIHLQCARKGSFSASG